MTESIGFRLLGEGLSVARVDINLLAELSPAVDHRIAQPFNFTLSSNGCPLKNPIDS
jgi:hypothetical protein